jgi:hypothetical protein
VRGLCAAVVDDVIVTVLEIPEDRALKENHQKVVHKKSDRVSIDQLIAVGFCLRLWLQYHQLMRWQPQSLVVANHGGWDFLYACSSVFRRVRYTPAAPAASLCSLCMGRSMKKAT